ncbi:MAG: phenylalanine--tRNA ligase subunit alpha [Candidatus Woesearchaeota archaeon]
MENIAETLHPLERKVFPLLKDIKQFDRLVGASGLSEVEVMRAIQWLQNKDLIKVHTETLQVATLDKNGSKYLKQGLPERKFLNTIKEDTEISVEDVAKRAALSPEEVSVCLGILKSKAAINLIKRDKIFVSLTEYGRRLVETEFLEEKFLKSDFPIDVKLLKEEEKFAFDNLIKRRQIIKTDEIKRISIELTQKGKELISKKIDENYAERLTPHIIKSGIWRNIRFRRYDVKINVPQIHGGKRHFVDQSINYIKRIWLELGFKEMKGTLVQTSFWDLDSLFVPQDHPARDMQDTFYIKEPRYGKLPKEYMKIVKETHENGWTTGSRGWGYKWSEDVARENLLRTHTTVLSARTLSKIKSSDLPAKFFSVKKVFRNETLSWKHLFEFIQVEGIVVSPDANFKHLKGYLKTFFLKMGFANVRIRPGHFPYTEPSAEVDVWHPQKNRWVELGGSGIFRPEVTKPLLGEEIPVLAWGLGLERTIMEYYGIEDVRELYQNDLKKIRELKLWMR